MSKTTTIVFQGDSITDCGRSREVIPATDGRGLGTGYPSMVAARLLCDQAERNWQFFNRGISGNRVVDLYARWKIDTLNLKPDILSILIGINDTWHEVNYRNGVEVPRYAQFLRMLLEWTRQELPKTKLILLEPFVFPFGAATSDWVAEVDARRTVVKQLSEEFGTVFVPTQSILNKALKKAPAEHWLADGVHPLPAGHMLITEAWLKAAADLLKK